MRGRILVLVALLALGAVPCGWAESHMEAATKPFGQAVARFEQNATDGDVEAVFEILGGEEGLSSLKVVSPDGRTIVDFSAPDAGVYGIRQFRFESPEPKDVAGLKKAYPEGAYTFTGTSASGVKLSSQATLHHLLPPTASSVTPRADAAEVPTRLTITWAAKPGLSAIMIEVAQEQMNHNVSARLPGSATSFVVPAGFLKPGKEYTLAVGTVGANGNMAFVESSFSTAATTAKK